MRQQRHFHQAARLWTGFVFAIYCLTISGCADTSQKPPKNDEAMKRALVEETRIDSAAKSNFLPRKIEDYFKGMDAITAPRDQNAPDQLLDIQLKNRTADASTNTVEQEKAKQTTKTWIHKPAQPAELSTSETLGRNTWMAWCAGNEGFWDWLATDSLGFIDLLKLVDSRKRNQRFDEGGLINEPEMTQATQAPPGEFGLWLDRPEDPRLRKWRRAYVAQTFEKLRQNKHKSQVGLKKGGAYAEEDTKPLYLGEPKAFKDSGYDYPSSYMKYSRANPDKAERDGYEASRKYDEYEKYDEYDRRIPPPDIYGISSGVVGLRLFPNPYFDEEAQKKWDPERYYTDKSYWSDPTLIRPYRVGVSCAYCHASYHPLNPPRSLTQPEWSNLSGNIGAQYLRIRVAFGNLLTKDQFIYHLLDSQPPGTIDTSLIASDNINNPNTMNAVFKLPERVVLSLRNPHERISPDSAELPAVWKHPELKPNTDAFDRIPIELRQIFESQGLGQEIADSNGNPRRTPRVLLDGSDSIGAWGALARVYLNIGSYWEQWNEVHQPVVGFAPQRPLRLRDCESHSVYWNATKLRVGGLRDYFLKVTPSMRLLSTPDGKDRIEPIDAAHLRQEAAKSKQDITAIESRERARKVDVSKLARGRQVFAKNCIVCHSSIQPESSAITLHPIPDKGPETPEAMAAKTARDTYNNKYAALIEKRLKVRNDDAIEGEFWEHNPEQWLNNPTYLEWAREIVEEPAFWHWNYLSTDYRIPVTLVGTNSSRAMGTNAVTGHVWEDFASESYRSLPSPGPISYFNPYAGDKGENREYTPRHKSASDVPTGGGGPGYYRVPSLVSIWATAPFLHNNSLGLFNNDPSVNGRLDAFDDAIRKLLWPEKRLQSSSYNDATPERLASDHGLIWRTTEVTTLSLDAKRVPYFAKQVPFISALSMKYPWLGRIAPLWLPSAIFLIGSLLILLVHNNRTRRCWGYSILAGTLFFWLVITLSKSYPQWECLDLIRQIQPIWLPLATLFGLSLVLLLHLRPTCRRWIAYLSVAAALLIGAIVYFNAGKLGDASLGPIPKGTPVNLIANFNSEAAPAQQFESLQQALAGLAEIETRNLKGPDADQVLKRKVAPALMEVNKCPDFIMDKGHYFEWFKTMTDDDKNALIELLKTF